jgi:hypothetical protein
MPYGEEDMDGIGIAIQKARQFSFFAAPSTHHHHNAIGVGKRSDCQIFIVLILLSDRALKHPTTAGSAHYFVRGLTLDLHKIKP